MDPWYSDGDPFGVVTMYADGESWDQMVAGSELTQDEIERMGFDKNGLNPGEPGGRYSQIDLPFPSIEASRTLCGLSHKFNKRKDDVYEGHRLVGDLREKDIRCARCALSYSVLANQGLHNPGDDEWLDSEEDSS